MLEGLNPANIQGAGTDFRLDLTRLTAESRAPELEAVRAALTFDELRLRLSDIPVEQKSPSTIRLENGKVEVADFTLTGPDTELNLAGSATLLDTPAADFRFQGRLETGLLAGLLDPLRLRGPATIDLARAARWMI